ncbi:hypothetical protein LAZ67_23001512 [Cordylochernes scorpioides]|uniref:Uncharacterized protein n=1 Tax=Cordylochernes scorpioides TaxID=51811 RepID=A0ABY6LQR6_9ARAC|nr:hypothetical protein LAZ67_23001512 [Cordylochernes scorpioides]
MEENRNYEERTAQDATEDMLKSRETEIVMCSSESSEEIAQDFTMENSVTGWLVKAYIKGFPDSCQFTRRGLAFLINNLYYKDIAVNIPNTLDLEVQGIKKLAPRPKLAQLRKIMELQKG